MNNSRTCDRAEQLVSVLYGEATEQETREFHRHLETCKACETEMTSFANIRESIEAYKLEALSGAITFGLSIPTPRTKSALVAVREFFRLSPLWLKGAAAFASLLFVVFAVTTVVNLNRQPPVIVTTQGGKYTEEEKNQIVQKALAEQKASFVATLQQKNEEIAPVKVDSNNRSKSRSPQVAKSSRPLSKLERQQLAADLRLLQQHDDEGLDLISDRINQ